MSKGRRKHLTVIRKKRAAKRADARKAMAAFNALIRDESGAWFEVEVQPVTTSTGTFHGIGTKGGAA